MRSCGLVVNIEDSQEHTWVMANCQGNLEKCLGVNCHGQAFYQGVGGGREGGQDTFS